MSTSPIAAGFPSRPHPVIVDLATTAGSRGEIAARAAQGQPLPDGWAFDATGAPTTDPAKALAGTLAPLGGVKGFALAFLVECLTGGLVGPSTSIAVADPMDPRRSADPQGIGHLVIAIDPAAVDVDGQSSRRLAYIVETVRQAGSRPPGASRTLPDDLDSGHLLHVPRTVLDTLAGSSARRAATREEEQR